MDTKKKNKKATMSSILGNGIPGGMTSLINEVESKVSNENTTIISASDERESIEKLLRYYKEKGRTSSNTVYVDDEVRSYLTKIRSTKYFGQFTTGQIVSAIVTQFFNKNKDEIKSELLSNF